MITYQIKNIEPSVWASVKRRAQLEQRSVREVIMECLHIYITHGLPPRQAFQATAAKEIKHDK